MAFHVKQIAVLQYHVPSTLRGYKKELGLDRMGHHEILQFITTIKQYILEGEGNKLNSLCLNVFHGRDYNSWVAIAETLRQKKKRNYDPRFLNCVIDTSLAVFLLFVFFCFKENGKEI